MFKGEWSDELVYALLAEEWPVLRRRLAVAGSPEVR
jgi:hypothetical protein